MKKNKYMLIISSLIVAIASIIILFATYYDNHSIRALIIVSIVVQVINIVINRKNNLNTIFGVFLISYYLPLYYKYYEGYNIYPYGFTVEGKAGLMTTVVYCVFAIVYSIILILLRDKVRTGVNFTYKMKFHNNNFIFALIIVLISISIMLGHSGSFAIGGTYGKGSSTVNAINEYVIILFIIAWIYCGKTTGKKFILYFLISIYSIVNILYGDRIGILMLAIAIFFMQFNEKFNIKHIVISIVVIGSVFAIIGNLRTHGKIIRDDGNHILESNQGNVLVASNQIIRLRDEVIFTKSELSKYAVQYFSRVIIPQGGMSEMSDPGVYAYNYYNQSLGGGFIAAYFYLWFGMSGVVIAAMLIGLLITRIKSYENNYLIVFMSTLIAFFPRWIAYEPLQMLKAPIIAIGVYLIFDLINHMCVSIVKYR